MVSQKVKYNSFITHTTVYPNSPRLLLTSVDKILYIRENRYAKSKIRI